MTRIQDTGPSRSFGCRVGRAVAGGAVVALLALAACGTGGPADQDSSSPTASPTSTSPTPTASPTSTSASPSPSPTASPTAACATPTRAAAIYYAADVADVGPRLYREWVKVATCEDPITEAVGQMFRVAPADPDYTSLWSSSTEVLAVTTSGSTATVDVSEFPSLGAAFEGAAVQQLVWTATAADTSVKGVRLLVDGEVPDSGHHDWSNPVSRANALETLANAWILAPTQGATVTSPVAVRIYGTGWEGYIPLMVFRGNTVVAETHVLTMMGGFAQASTKITLPAGDYVIHAYNDNGRDASLFLWDTKAFTVR